MYPVTQLYQQAEASGISVYEYSLPENGSVSVMDDDGRCYIGMDQSVMDGDALERVHLGHELGHCLTGSFYNRYSPYDLRQRHENRADKWAISHLVTGDALDDAVAEGCCEIWSLAERFGVTERFMQKAVCYYVHGNVATELYF
jgi:hypothetical protein